jgi:large subunit ribosomal protein L9
MKIILYKDVPNLGEEGDVKVVANGYARNFLIPKKFAVRYTKSTEIELAQKQQAIARRKAEKASAASDTKTRIEALEMDMAVAAGDKGKLFGSVTSTAIVDFLHSRGIEVERKKVELPDGGIKIVGTHSVKVKLYGGEEAMLNVNVTASSDKPETERAAAAPAAKTEAPAAAVAEEKPAVEEAAEEAAEETVSEESVSEEPASEEEES